jgi:osmotically-inducible protein OsmY
VALWACGAEPPDVLGTGAELRPTPEADQIAELRPSEATEPSEATPDAEERPQVPPEVLAQEPAVRIPGEVELRRLLEGEDAPDSERGSVAAARNAAAERDLASEREAFEQARAELDVAKSRVEQKSQALTAARENADNALAEVDAVERELRAAESELRRAEESLAALGEAEVTVDDSELFRLVQRELLEAGALSRVAISAEVNDGEVTLRGVVPDEETRRAAEEIARTQPGVTGVANEIRVKDSRGPRGG